MATTVARGSYINSTYIKPVLRKAYHKKGGNDILSDAVKLNGEEVKNKGGVATSSDHRDGEWWVRDNRTGIYYPKGQEKVIEEVSSGKDVEINWFSNHENYFN